MGDSERQVFLLEPPKKETWGNAEEYCKQSDGHLASITSEEIHNYLYSKADWGHHGIGFWVGGIDQEEEGNWEWTDGSPWTYTKWGEKQPDNGAKENCLEIDRNGWNDQSCYTTRKFVCSRKICSGDTSNNNNNNTFDTSSPRPNSTTDKIGNASSAGGSPIMEVAIPSGILLLVSILVVIGCVTRKRPQKKQEMDADENPVYRVYQLTETYERQYSTNEAIDNNDYYGQ